MTAIIFLVFCIVYLGMILGGLPFLQLDRRGIGDELDRGRAGNCLRHL